MMKRYFNVTGACNVRLHYMVDLQPRLKEIKALIDSGAYFAINRARQYGKTTVLSALKNYLQNEYLVISIDFQMFSHANFESEHVFVKSFSEELLFSYCFQGETAEVLKSFSEEDDKRCNLRTLFQCMSSWCARAGKPVVLMIDEVDSAANNQVFLDFLAQLRGYYIHREERATFQSVILAGVYDVKNIRQKLRSERGKEHSKTNSPWNIATDFMVNMSFTPDDIAGMLCQYERDHHTGMDVAEIADFIYDYTSGYPFLVSCICKLIDERITGKEEYLDKKDAWTKAGVLEAVKILLAEKNTLFDSLIHKLADYPKLRELLYSMLLEGMKVTYNPDQNVIDIASMFGFVKNDHGSLVVSNRVFETRLYNFFLSDEEVNSQIFSAGTMDKNLFVQNGRLNMEQVLERFVVHWGDLYSSADKKFIEDNGRKFFLLYLKPIINGTGNYYIEARTRDNRRTDVIVDYKGEQFVVELKIWHGNAYHERGEIQLMEYLDYYHLKKGYMLSFNFNKNKVPGVKEICLGDKVLVEAVV